MRELAAWQTFYEIVGSSAGALIGLQFVVMALIADVSTGGDPAAGEAFGTPTVVHFSTPLLVAALLSAPWRGRTGPALLVGLLGLLGVAYEIIVARRMAKQTAYAPVFEDWLCHAVLPMAAYAALAASAYAARAHTSAALFGIAAATLTLLFIGIHNAWDAVTYHVYTRRGKKQ